MVKVTGGELRLVGGHPADMYYIPKKYLKDYATLLKVFFKHLVFLEAAIITVQACIEDHTQTQVRKSEPGNWLRNLARLFHLGGLRPKDRNVSPSPRAQRA